MYSTPAPPPSFFLVGDNKLNPIHSLAVKIGKQLI